MEENYCKDCRHYIQHYAFVESRMIQVYCGHCTRKTPKTKRPDRKACEHFERGVKDIEQFVSKEYLSKKLLDKILSMELLPEIEEFPI